MSIETALQQADRGKAYRKAWYLANREKVIAATRAYRAKNLDRCKARDRAYHAENAAERSEYQRRYRVEKAEVLRAKGRRHREEDAASSMLKHARYSAKQKNLPFDLVKEDIEIPLVCPVLGVTLSVALGIRTSASPSLDRIVPGKGYVKGNIRVVSWRANNLKSDATLQELQALVRYLESSGVY